MLNYYMEEPGMVCSDWLRKNEGLTPTQLKQMEGLGQLHGVEIEHLDGAQLGGLNSALGIIPDWQFYPQPPPVGTGKYSNVTVDLPGACPSYGISGAMGLHDPVLLPTYEEPKTGWFIAAMIAFAIHSAIRLPLAVVDGIHGYKRNDGDPGSAAVWGILGFMFPLSTTTVAVVQGYGDPK
jgi:hypothetical protein